ncbi:MAG: hypothetical protein DHS20C18_20780 [Saprospiraceae bacterium]|nr:MAG: hypothetical protein DHS20C18_20780 [Saprospiraceae bacterium]
MKIFNLILCALFILFAAVQYNDPDPMYWMLLYLYVAAMCGLAAFGKYYRPVLLGGLLICVIWVGTLVPDFINWVKMGTPNIAEHMKADTPYVELTREFFGLLICILALVFLWRRSRKATIADQ